MSKVIIIGLDGATWDLLKPWADEGELPTFKKLMKNGVWGTLESTTPPVTGPAWTSFSTGKNPGKHGIFDFVKLENNSLRLYKSKDIRSETIHEILSKRNLRSIVIGLPLAFPPSSDFNGIMLSDFLYPSKEIFPKSEKGYIEDYRVLPDFFLTREEDLLQDMVETAKSQVKVAKELFIEENWDFYFFYFQETDSVLHCFWKDVSHNTTMAQKAKRIFYIADEFLEWILDEMDADTILFLMSDHGFADCPYKINLNSIFMKRGLLRTRIKDASEDETLGKLVETFRKQEQRTIAVPKSLFRIATHPVIRPISERIFKAIFGGAKARSSAGIDFDSSKVFVPTSESMSIYVRETERKKREEIVEEIVETLRELEYKGQRVFKEVLVKDGVYSGPFIESSPDILLTPNGFHISSALSDKVYGEFDRGGWHDLRGVFLAYGSNIITSSEELTNLKIYDIAPTILHVFGLPIPRDMDGRVLKEVFKHDSELASRPIEYTRTDEREHIKRKVSELKRSKGI